MRWFCLLAWMFPFAVATADSTYLEELIQRSRTQGLAERDEWLRLGHYEAGLLLPGVESLVDSANFFSSPRGKWDPRAELEATLAGFFSAETDTDERPHSQCRFVARYHWLKHELQFDDARLPPQPCARFNHWRNGLAAQEITLVFPAAFLNSPASMYGHTLLRIDAKGQDERTRLLAYSISFAASTDETNGVIFAVKGLFGGYPGVFSTAPYYLKVREYTDIENRDIWEYRLNFTPDEIDRLLMHVWELGPTYFDYYFFDENCAYHLLSLLEVARPGLELTDQFRWWAIPSDTVRAVTESAGLLKQAVYRPATVTTLRHRMRGISGERRLLAKALAEERVSVGDDAFVQLPPQERAQVLELAYEYVNYLRLRGERKDEELERHAHELLLTRSRLQLAAATSPPPVPAVRPDQGHESARGGAALGRERGRNFVELDLRPTYHGLMDPEPGYIRGAQTEFFHTRLRRYEADTNVEVEEFTPINIVSLSPRDEFFKPISWKAGVGWLRRATPDGARPLTLQVDVAGGYAWESEAATETEHGPLFYALLNVTAVGSGHFEDDYALGIGPTVGGLWDVTPAWRLYATGRWQRFGMEQYHDDKELTLSQRWSLSSANSVRLDLAHRRLFDDSSSSAIFYWFHYF